jgi:hypothetical protein
MKPIFSFLKIAAILSLVVVIAGCSVPQAVQQPTQPSAPTVDMGALRTQVAQTVVANLTVQAALNPSATPLPTEKPTTASTLAPTPTTVVIETNTPFAMVTSTLDALSQLQATPTWRVYPTSTKVPYSDACSLVSTSPEDGLQMSAGQDFDAVWVIKNTGFSDWDGGFYFQKVKGTLGPSDTTYISGTVTPGNTYTLTYDMTAPTQPGVYNGTYKFVHVGVAFCQFFVSIEVK